MPFDNMKVHVETVVHPTLLTLADMDVKRSLSFKSGTHTYSLTLVRRLRDTSYRKYHMVRHTIAVREASPDDTPRGMKPVLQITIRTPEEGAPAQRGKQVPVWFDVARVSRCYRTIGEILPLLQRFASIESLADLQLTQLDVHHDLRAPVQTVLSQVTVDRKSFDTTKQHDTCMHWGTGRTSRVRIYDQDPVSPPPDKHTRIEVSLRSRDLQTVLGVGGPVLIPHLRLMLDPSVNPYFAIRRFRLRAITPRKGESAKERDDAAAHVHLTGMRGVVATARAAGVRLSSWLEEDRGFSTRLAQANIVWLRSFLADLADEPRAALSSPSPVSSQRGPMLPGRFPASAVPD